MLFNLLYDLFTQLARTKQDTRSQYCVNCPRGGLVCSKSSTKASDVCRGPNRN